MIYNFHRKDQNNVGDMMCSPLLYFKFPLPSKTIDIHTYGKYEGRRNLVVIVGGGGLAIFRRKMWRVANNKHRVLIGWGWGNNNHHETKLEYPYYMRKYDLIGIRDWQPYFRWVPCPSCMHPLLNKRVPTERNVAIYEHHGRPPIPIKGFKRMQNNGNFKEVIQFLASSDLILTNTYHGVYWSILLGKKTVVFPFSNRFRGLKHEVPLCKPKDWEAAAKDAQAYPSALQECRKANKKFYEDVISLLQIKWY